MGKSNIPWTDDVWNPVVGCTHAGMAGCDNCYAAELHQARHMAHFLGKKVPPQYAKRFTEIQLLENRLDWPLHWRKPRKIFVDSMSDLFHKDVPIPFLGKLFHIMRVANRHTYQILTKRPERARAFLNHYYSYLSGLEPAPTIPLPNVHILASVSTQAEMDKAEKVLWQIPAVVRGFSFEPLLGPIRDVPPFEWHIVGCESGPNRRPCKLEWVRDIVRQCREAHVPVFVKQIDTRECKKNDVHPGDKFFLGNKVSTNPRDWPPDLRIREYPE